MTSALRTHYHLHICFPHLTHKLKANPRPWSNESVEASCMRPALNTQVPVQVKFPSYPSFRRSSGGQTPYLVHPGLPPSPKPSQQAPRNTSVFHSVTQDGAAGLGAHSGPSWDGSGVKGLAFWVFHRISGGRLHTARLPRWLGRSTEKTASGMHWLSGRTACRLQETLA